MEKIGKFLEQKPHFTPMVVCYLREGDNVLLGLRKKVSSGFAENLISGIGGKVGDKIEYADETEEEALIREAQEEIGVKILRYKRIGTIRFIFSHKPKWNQIVYIFIVDHWEGEPKETEVIKPIWFRKTQLPLQQMWDDNAYWVPKVLAGEKIDAVFLLGEDNKVVEYKYL